METVPDLPSPVAAAAALHARQDAVAWFPSRWRQALPAYAHLLDELPPLLDRATVRQACAGVEPHEALVVTMAWGFAKTGYGPHRVQKMVATEGLHGRLATVLRALDEQGALEAYRLLGGACRIVELGPAFGTKFLFFHDESALILDAIIGEWFQTATGEDLRVTRWRPPSYERYLLQMSEWGAETSVAPALLEERAFLRSTSGGGSQWDQSRASSADGEGEVMAEQDNRAGKRGAKVRREVRGPRHPGGGNSH